MADNSWIDHLMAELELYGAVALDEYDTLSLCNYIEDLERKADERREA